MLPRDRISKILTQTFETKFNYKIDTLLFSNNSTILISITKDIFYIDQTIITDIHTSLANQFRKLNHNIKIQNISYHRISDTIMMNFYFNIYKIEDSIKLTKLKSTNNLDRVTYNSSLDIDYSNIVSILDKEHILEQTYRGLVCEWRFNIYDNINVFNYNNEVVVLYCWNIDLSININNYKNITKWYIASSSNRAAELFKNYFNDKLNEK